MHQLLRRALVSGTAVSVLTTVALAATAAVRGQGATRPVNATSHWVHGPSAGRVRGGDARHTLVGYATHHAASVFWAAMFEWLRARRPHASPLGDALMTSAIAAFVDYGIVPKRLTPGWELVVPKRPIAFAYVMMAFALAASDRWRHQ
jgi:hypothetical protein